MTHHNLEWRRRVDQTLGFKGTEYLYEEVWTLNFGRRIALRLSLEELWSNIKRVFMEGLRSKIKNKKS